MLRCEFEVVMLVYVLKYWNVDFGVSQVGPKRVTFPVVIYHYEYDLFRLNISQQTISAYSLLQLEGHSNQSMMLPIFQIS